MRPASTYDYAVVRVVPRVDRGEFVNAGVIVACMKHGWLQARIELDDTRLLALDAGADVAAIRDALDAIPRICAGGHGGGRSRPAVVARAFRLAGGTAQHRGADVAGAQRPLRRRSGRDDGTPAGAPGAPTADDSAEQPWRADRIVGVAVETRRADGAVALVAADHHLLAFLHAPGPGRRHAGSSSPCARRRRWSSSLSRSSASVSSAAAPAKARPWKSLRRP